MRWNRSRGVPTASAAAALMGSAWETATTVPPGWSARMRSMASTMRPCISRKDSPPGTRRTRVGFGRRRVGIGVNRRATYPPAMDSLEQVTAEIVDCFKCPRLVAWRQQVAIEKRASFRDQEYWGRPVPGFGDPRATLL